MNAYWLIDGSYMFKASKYYRKQQSEALGRIVRGIDYVKLKALIRSEIMGTGGTLRSYYFNATPNPSSDAQNAFHRWLQSAEPRGPGIRIERLYQLKRFTKTCNFCGKDNEYEEQKGVDVGLVTLALRYSDRYDTLILSAGDGDYIDALRYLNETLEKQIYIVGFSRSISTDIQPYAARILDIADFYNEVEDNRDIVIEPYDDANSLADYSTD